jgi:hypothetical protein
MVIMPVAGEIKTALPSVTDQVTVPVPPVALSCRGASPNVTVPGFVIIKGLTPTQFAVRATSFAGMTNVVDKLEALAISTPWDVVVQPSKL